MIRGENDAEKFLKEKRIHVWPAPDGFVIRVDAGGKEQYFIEGDEMDAILVLGRIKRLVSEETANTYRSGVV